VTEEGQEVTKPFLTVVGRGLQGRNRRREVAVGALPQKYREVVVLRYLEGLGTDEICDLLAITANAMQVRLNRAKKKLNAR